MPRTSSHQPDAQSVTTAAQSRHEDQSHRLHQYLLTMSLRTVCFVLAIVFDGWLRWVFAAGAILLPFFAVVAANAVAPRVRGRVHLVNPVHDPTPQITDRGYEHAPATRYDVRGEARPSTPAEADEPGPARRAG
ncbi:DUF3099 domain-containing protein [Phycicoccus flavus]|uniref:DUF3099 domain-containing protein n=1 Tax=Phycicoccus flavus TaxID=2502783 RepID=UPI000FEBFA83|nr:DUF3099 domain-containing protein [Phycicoccus flavus]NHA69084.1 DUF3099 domain-containing protein [Phycicoccus flavus]